MGLNMNYFKHTGIYVDNLLLMSEFYKKTFDLLPVCENEPDEGKLYEDLYGFPDAKVIITKLVSEYGRLNGKGDMLELIQLCMDWDYRSVYSEKVLGGEESKRKERYIYQTGMAHIAIGVADIDKVLKKLHLNGGIMLTDILLKGSRKCCFCKDPEGNFIEVIE